MTSGGLTCREGRRACRGASPGPAPGAARGSSPPCTQCTPAGNGTASFKGQGKNHSWIGKLNHQDRTPFRLTHIAARRGAELKQQQQEEEAQRGSHGHRHQAPQVASRSPAAQSKTKLTQVGREPEWSGLKGEEEALDYRRVGVPWPPPQEQGGSLAFSAVWLAGSDSNITALLQRGLVCLLFVLPS